MIRLLEKTLYDLEQKMARDIAVFGFRSSSDVHLWFEISKDLRNLKERLAQNANK